MRKESETLSLLALQKVVKRSFMTFYDQIVKSRKEVKEVVYDILRPL